MRMFVVILFFFFFCGAPHARAAYRPDGLSVEEMLKATLEDLQERVGEILENNRKLSTKIDALRRRGLMLREEIRDLGDQKISAMERSMDIADLVRQEAPEGSLLEKELKGLRTRLARLQQQKDVLKKQIKVEYASQEVLEDKTEEFFHQAKQISERLSEVRHQRPVDYSERVREWAKKREQARNNVHQEEIRVDSLRQDIKRLQGGQDSVLEEKAGFLQEAEMLDKQYD